ncbi:MAG: rhamnogalacturonan lyase [Deltaproteobacteria bacterium]|nr:rhamnogalacturonan lyase [Deltaproteobacteria bacterium]
MIHSIHALFVCGICFFVTACGEPTLIAAGRTPVSSDSEPLDSDSDTAMDTGTELTGRQVEALDRGVVALMNTAGDVVVSWRINGYESLDMAFNVYRDGTLLNISPLTGATFFIDVDGTVDSSYTVAVVEGSEIVETSAPVNCWSGLSTLIPLTRPADGVTRPYTATNSDVVEEYPDGQAYTYSPNDMAPGDLDGDGRWELVFKWQPSNSRDNAHEGVTGNVYFEAIELDGTQLWRIDLGPNIRSGPHYTQFIVADLDLDGRAEMLCKTAPGTRDASGAFLHTGPAAAADHGADYVNAQGRILDGPEFLTVFGPDGMELATVDFYPERGAVADWGDNYGNRVDHFLAGLAYLDGVHPSAIFVRGYYTRLVTTAWNWDGQMLSRKWVFDSNDPGNENAFGQGNHNMAVGDVDDDGFDEIIHGACAIDHDGTFMYATGLGHGDAIHLTDIDPDRPGLELMTPHEVQQEAYPGTEVHDARTGEILFVQTVDNTDVGRGIAADIDAAFPGFEVWSSATVGFFSIDGTQVAEERPSVNFRIYWDGDLQDELLDTFGDAPSAMKIEGWNGAGLDRLVSTDDRYGDYVGIANNGSKANPCLVADILGDWREELILRAPTDDALVLYSTVTPTEYRLYTLMHDPVYRSAVAAQNIAYNQPPHLGFYIGGGLENIPVPHISPVRLRQ